MPDELSVTSLSKCDEIGYYGRQPSERNGVKSVLHREAAGMEDPCRGGPVRFQDVARAVRDAGVHTGHAQPFRVRVSVCALLTVAVSGHERALSKSHERALDSAFTWTLLAALQSTVCWPSVNCATVSFPSERPCGPLQPAPPFLPLVTHPSLPHGCCCEVHVPDCL